MLQIITGDHLVSRRNHSNEMDCYLEELEREVADGSGRCVAVVEDPLGGFRGAIIAWGSSGDRYSGEKGATAYYAKEGVFGPVSFVLSWIVEDDLQFALK